MASSPSPTNMDECPSNMPSGVCKRHLAATMKQQDRPSSSTSAGQQSSTEHQQQSTASNKDNVPKPPPPPRIPCGVFMAQSTLGNSSNLGIFTGMDLQKGDVIHYPEIVIPLAFRPFGVTPPPEYQNDGSLWDRYVWEGTLLNIESYHDTRPLEQGTRAAFVPGVGCTVNSVLDLHNIHSTHGSHYDTAGLTRERDPGAGAFSPYHGANTTVAIRRIAAGSELLAKYGDYWIPDLEGVAVTLAHPVHQAEQFLERDYVPFVLSKLQSAGPELKEALWQFTLDFPIDISEENGNQAMTNLPRRYQWKDVEDLYLEKQRQKQQQQCQTNSENKDDDDENSEQKSCPNPDTDAAIESNENDEDDDHFEFNRNHKPNMDNPYSLVQSFFREREYMRSMDWLYENGYCQDHLRPGLSQIPQAGRGAFAARDLPAQTVVGFAPLIHVGLHGRSLYTIEYNNYKNVETKRLDLVINYSFGHPNSTVLLTPYGSIVNYINHNSEAPNVRVQWPTREFVSHNSRWLKKDPVFLKNVRDKVGLSLEYVALRDIAEGEEVVMDYGPLWEEAWNEHVKQWKPLPDADKYKLAENVDEPYFRTVHELGRRPYPTNVATMCLGSYTGLRLDTKVTRHNQIRPTYKWIPALSVEKKDIPKRHFCVVVERHKLGSGHGENAEELGYEYTVDLKVNETESADSWIRIVNMPPEGIGLYNLAYTNDWHMPNVFRHYIPIPNEIMPNAWINRLSKT